MSSNHDYGLKSVETFLLTNDFGWSKPKEDSKKVTLVNVDDCENKLNANDLLNEWKESGHVEWEALLAYWFTSQVVDAIKRREKTADITVLFDRDLTMTIPGKVFTREEIYAHIIPSFDIIEETDKELKLSLHIK